MAHRFALGQHAEFLPGPGEPVAERGRCEVTRLLPQDEGEWQYLVRSTKADHERRVRESQLRALPSLQAASGPASTGKEDSGDAAAPDE